MSPEKRTPTASTASTASPKTPASTTSTTSPTDGICGQTARGLASELRQKPCVQTSELETIGKELIVKITAETHTTKEFLNAELKAMEKPVRVLVDVAERS